MTDHPPDPPLPRSHEGDDDAESTIDVDPAWIASLRAGALSGHAASQSADPDPGRPAGTNGDAAVDGRDDGGVAGDDIETTIDASDELLQAISEHAGTTSHGSRSGDRLADLAHLPPPPVADSPPPSSGPASARPASTEPGPPEPAPSPTPAAALPPPPSAPSADAVAPVAVQRWTPSDRLTSRSRLAVNHLDDPARQPAPPSSPWKAVVAAVVVTAAVLVGAWAVFVRDDTPAPTPPVDSEPFEPSEGGDFDAPPGDPGIEEDGGG